MVSKIPYPFLAFHLVIVNDASGSSTVVSSDGNFPEDTWVHVVVSISDGSRMTMWRDGVRVATTSSPNMIAELTRDYHYIRENGEL